MSDLSSLLAPIRAREAAATEGPWYVDDEEQTVRAREYAGEIMFDRSAECRSEWTRNFKPDAAFIASARSDIPRLLSALDKVIALHAPDTYGECRRCMHGPGKYFAYPCPTVRAVTAALGEQA